MACEVCEAIGVATDITPQPRGYHISPDGTRVSTSNRGVVDHIVPIQQGGSKWDADNHMGMCGEHHDKKRGKESHGYCVEAMQGRGGLIPRDRYEIIEALIKEDNNELWIQ